MRTPEHTRLITAAAKSVLRPIGCSQKGRSRIWLDDQSWWLGVIEFQPSGWSQGSYLNVGACWLWYENDHLSFDAGHRVEDFRPFLDVGQFAASAQILAERAKSEVIGLRARFPTLAHVSAHLVEETPRTIWDQYHAAVSAGLMGQMTTAKKWFDAVMSSSEEFAWATELKRRTGELSRIVANTKKFEAEVKAIVARRRALLKLSDRDVAI